MPSASNVYRGDKMESWLVQFLLLYVTFLAMFSPPATMTAAAILLGGIPNTALRRVAWRVAWEYVFVMMIVIWLGNYMLTALGLSTHALTATGGAALLFQGWPLMTRGTKAEQSNALLNSESPRNVNDLAVVPLLFPLSIGGGTIAVGISSAAHSSTLDGLLMLSAVILAEYGIALKKINMRGIGWTGWKIVLLQLFFAMGIMRILTGFTAIL